MKRSTERILTTHVGSLARPRDLLEIMREKEHGRPYDPEAFAARVRSAVADVVRRQAECGIDVVADGEQGKVSFASYVVDRLDGFQPASGRNDLPGSWTREIQQFPEYYEEYLKKYSAAVSPISTMVCTGPISYRGQQAVQTDIANLKAAMEGGVGDPGSPGRKPQGGTPPSGQGLRVEEAFMPAIVPYGFTRNEHYRTEEEFVEALGEALREEYQAVVDAGLLLQVDDPMLTEIVSEDPSTTPAQRRRAAEQHVEAINHALRGIPTDRVRYHTCYGLNHGPRLHDAPMTAWVDLMLKVDAAAYSFEVANPRHMHEWHVWESVKLPAGKALIPGFLGHANNFVEHPELIADQVVTYAGLVGRENVLAGADCGFSSRASFAPEVHPTVVWAKFEALAEGARLASTRLWSD
jgi:5-methyltetrahydropteroyltriglutamate--homocysteine methyltransferase